VRIYGPASTRLGLRAQNWFPVPPPVPLFWTPDAAARRAADAERVAPAAAVAPPPPPVMAAAAAAGRAPRPRRAAVGWDGGALGAPPPPPRASVGVARRSRRPSRGAPRRRRPAGAKSFVAGVAQGLPLRNQWPRAGRKGGAAGRWRAGRFEKGAAGWVFADPHDQRRIQCGVARGAGPSWPSGVRPPPPTGGGNSGFPRRGCPARALWLCARAPPAGQSRPASPRGTRPAAAGDDGAQTPAPVDKRGTKSGIRHRGRPPRAVDRQRPLARAAVASSPARVCGRGVPVLAATGDAVSAGRRGGWGRPGATRRRQARRRPFSVRARQPARRCPRRPAVPAATGDGGSVAAADGARATRRRRARSS